MGEARSVSYRCDESAFLITVDGELAPDGSWQMEAVIRFKSTINRRRDRKAIDGARFAFFMGVIETEAWGRVQGATRGRLHVEGDADIIGAAHNVELDPLGSTSWKPGEER